MLQYAVYERTCSLHETSVKDYDFNNGFFKYRCESWISVSFRKIFWRSLSCVALCRLGIWPPYNTTSNCGHITFVSDRSVATLLPLIQAQVLPGSKIVSDQWAAHGGIQQLNVISPYDHVSVNHQVEFFNATRQITLRRCGAGGRRNSNKCTEPAGRWCSLSLS